MMGASVTSACGLTACVKSACVLYCLCNVLPWVAVTVKGCIAPPDNTTVAGSVGWSGSCATGVDTGTTCFTACKNATAAGNGTTSRNGTTTGNGTAPLSSGYYATCLGNNTWAVNGSCPACLDLPGNTSAPGSSAGWNASCALALYGAACFASCAVNSTAGSGYEAVCQASGSWLVNGSCATCLTAPYNTLAPGGAGFNSSACVPAAVGAVCAAACTTNSSFGSGYNATCTAIGTWLITGSCAACPEAPGNITAPGSIGWDSSCAPAGVGSACHTTCSANATTAGSGYTAMCTSNGTWAVNGSCATCLAPPDSSTAPGGVK